MDLSRLEGKRIMITGATGLIGGNLVRRLLKWNEHCATPISVMAIVRNPQKAEKMFASYQTDCLEIVPGDVCTLKPADMKIDYIIHGASQTGSKAFVQEPVETIWTGLRGTGNMLELARRNSVKGFVYLSSMEVYGSPLTDEKIDETHATNLDTMQVRSSYPESKRMCENLCVSYASEYGIPARVVRLTQTFGPGVRYDDGRVFAEFARCALEGRDIILHTKGETRRCYLYTEDAVNAILTVLLDGKDGEAYNAANEATYCSIYEMAKLVVDQCAGGAIRVRIEENADTAKMGYAPTLCMNLDTSRLQKLGWKPVTDLVQMYINMMQDMR